MNIRTLPFLALPLLFLSACSKSGNHVSSNEVSEELKQELIAIQHAVMPAQLNSLTPEEQIANIKKHSLPQTLAVIDGISFSRDQMISSIRNRKLDEQSVKLHDLKFTRAGNTIIIQGLSDRANVIDGKKTDFRNAYFHDIFTKVDGQWRILATLRITHPASGPPSIQNSKQ